MVTSPAFTSGPNTRRSPFADADETGVWITTLPERADAPVLATVVKVTDQATPAAPAGDAEPIPVPPGEPKTRSGGNGQAATSPAPPGNADGNGASANAVAIALRFAGAIAGQTTIIAALLFFFGWGELQTELGYFGINSTVANLSVDDYLLATPDLIIEVLLPLGAIALLSMAAHRRLRNWNPRHPNYLRRGIRIGIGIGALLCAAGLYEYLGPGQPPYSGQFPVAPVLLAAGLDLVVYLAYFAYMRRPPGKPGNDRLMRAQVSVVVALNVLLLFWTAALWSDISGVQEAEYVQSHLGNLTGVSVYSQQPLGLDGVHVTKLPGANQYPYRYTGLRFLLYSSGQYFLLPDSWKPGHDPVFLLRQGGSIRLEFYGTGRSAF
jgi:hypothetical protein